MSGEGRNGSGNRVELSARVANELKNLTADEGLAGDEASRQRRLRTLAPNLLALESVKAEAEALRAVDRNATMYEAARTVLDRLSDGWPDDVERLALRYGLGLESIGQSRARRFADGTEEARKLGLADVRDSTLANFFTKATGGLLTRFADALIAVGPVSQAPAIAEPLEEPAETSTFAGGADPEGAGSAGTGNEPDEALETSDAGVSAVAETEPTFRRSSPVLIAALALVVGLVVGGLLVYLLVGDDGGADQVDSAPGQSIEDGGDSASSLESETANEEGSVDEEPAVADAAPSTTEDVDPAAQEPTPTTESGEDGRATADESEPTPTTPAAPPLPVQLVTQTPLSGNYFETESNSAGTIWPSTGTINGESTGRILVASVDGFGLAKDTEATFTLDGQYEFLDIQLAFSPTSDLSGAALVTITVDGQSVIFSEPVAPGDAMEVERLPLNAGSQMQVLVEETNGSLCRTTDTGCEIYFLVADLIPFAS